MKLLNIIVKAMSILWRFVVCTLIVLAYSCGSGGSGSDSSEAGSVSFRLVMQDSGTSRALVRQISDGEGVQFECQSPDYVIDTIEAQVKDENGEIIAEGGPFACEQGKGTIDEIEPGQNYIVFIFAKDPSGEILFTGKSDAVTVVAGAVADAGLIALTSINERLVGDFIGAGFGFDDYDFYSWSVRSDAKFDGSGGGSFQDVAASDNILEGGTLTYGLRYDSSLSATLSNGTSFNGILNADNTILAVADTDWEDDSIEMDVVLKKSTGLSNAILNGEYIGVRISSDPSTALFTVTSHGDSTGEFKFLAASNNNLSSGAFAYSVGSDGEATIVGIQTGAVSSEGIVSGDGTVVSLVDTDFRGGNEDIDLTVLVKTESGLSNSTLNGEYTAVSFGYDFFGEGYNAVTTVMSITSDGVGNMVFKVLSDSNGDSGLFEATYSVGSNGRITINLPNDEVYEGIISGNGEVFTFVNTNLNDDFSARARRPRSPAGSPSDRAGSRPRDPVDRSGA